MWSLSDLISASIACVEVRENSPEVQRFLLGYDLVTTLTGICLGEDWND
jgi:hypothetical protein